MPTENAVAELVVDIGSDFACQLFWTDEYGEPVPISDPALCDVKDADGQIAIRFSATADPDTQARLDLNGYIGFVQMTAPAAVTQTLVPGRYVFDLWGSVADSASPFDRQLVKVLEGFVLAQRRVTVIESAPEAVISSDETIVEQEPTA